METGCEFKVGRSVRGFGKWFRVAVGVLGVAWALSSAGRHGLLPYAGLYFVAIAVAYLAAHRLLGEWMLSKMNPWIGTIILVGPAVVIPAIGAFPHALRLGMIAYFSSSLVLNAVMNYGGCEVLAIPSFLFRRWYTVYCPLNLVDVVENAVVGSGSAAKEPRR